MHRTYRLPIIGFIGHLALAISALLLGVSGCSPSGPTIATVSGKVTCNEQPVTEGVINFAYEAGFGIQSRLAADGSYNLISHHGEGIPLGSYKVTIEPPKFDPIPEDLSKPLPKRPEYSNIPKKYRSFSSSGFAVEVKEGGNVFDFDMKR